MVYAAAFKYMNDNIICLECKSIMTDYELAIRNGFLSVVPTAEVTSCLFHFKQAVKKKARKFNEMMRFIKSNVEAKKLYFKLMSLPLLPAVKIGTAFAKLEGMCIELQEKEGKGKVFDAFIHYIYNQWISGKHVSLNVFSQCFISIVYTCVTYFYM